MEITAPEYYRSFRCLASACPDSCCKEWAVQVDGETAARYRALDGILGDRLRAALTEEEGDTVLALSAGRCPMWREDGLCDIQAELGHDSLCQVCREFPRLRHDYGDFVELGLELSCPEAARMILREPAWKTAAWQAPGGETPEYDREAMAVLKASRKAALDFLDSPGCSAGEALAVLLLYGYAAQEALDGGALRTVQPEAALRSAEKFARPGDLQGIFDFYKELEILTQRWRARLDEGPRETPWPRNVLALARYGVERYWLQAVSDYDLAGRVKLVILSCLVVKAMGGSFVETAQLYAKEIENDGENVDAILDAVYGDPAFTDDKLLGLLLDVK